MNNNNYGTLQVRAYRASEALPVENAIVKITGADEYTSDVMLSRITESDGLTEEVHLPTPSIDLSLSPHPAQSPYLTFDVDIVKEGYYPKKIFNVPIFAGIKAMLPIEMIPVAYDTDGKIIPLENINSIIYENNL